MILPSLGHKVSPMVDPALHVSMYKKGVLALILIASACCPPPRRRVLNALVIPQLYRENVLGYYWPRLIRSSRKLSTATYLGNGKLQEAKCAIGPLVTGKGRSGPKSRSSAIAISIKRLLMSLSLSLATNLALLEVSAW